MSAASIAVVNVETRVPMALVLSIAIHGAGVLGFMHVSLKGTTEKVTELTGIELMDEAIKKNQPKALTPRAELRKQLAKDFFKMAMPKMPKLEPKRIPLDVRAPETHRSLMDLAKPKLSDRGRLKAQPKLALDLSRKKVLAQKMIAEPLVDRARAAPMALPKLEEIGTRQAAPKVLQLAKLADEKRMEAPRGLGEMSMKLDSRSAPKMAMPLLEEAAPRRESQGLGGFSSQLGADAGPALKLEPKMIPVRRTKRLAKVAPAKLPPKRRESGLRRVEKKKSVEIEGPLSNRRVVSHSIPAFPAWAQQQGIIEAEVVIKFYVDPMGFVIADEMGVQRTSGYGRLDRLAMNHLKSWRFERLPLGGRKEWGIITFRFLLE